MAIFILPSEAKALLE